MKGSTTRSTTTDLPAAVCSVSDFENELAHFNLIQLVKFNENGMSSMKYGRTKKFLEKELEKILKRTILSGLVKCCLT